MNKVIGFVMVGTNDLEKSSKFYDSVLAHLGMKRVTITERYIGYGHSSEDSGVKFYITKPIALFINNLYLGIGVAPVSKAIILPSVYL